MMPKERARSSPNNAAQVSLPRALSKLGYCSRSEATALVEGGRVAVNGTVERNAARRVDPRNDRIAVDGSVVHASKRIYLMLNKPRGVVTTASDELGRVTVHELLADSLGHLSAVGRLDKDSEGLLLLTNDTRWADGILAPESHVEKTYHVQVAGKVDEAILLRVTEGVKARRGDHLRARSARVLKTAGRSTWLEIVLDEGKNRHIRRLLEVLDLEVKRLMRMAIGPVALGDLESRAVRKLTEEEVLSLRSRSK